MRLTAERFRNPKLPPSGRSPISRRDFLRAAVLGSAACVAGCGRWKDRHAGNGEARFRTITYNVFACYGWLPNEEKFKQRRAAAKDKQARVDMAARFAEALQPFDADLITFQEAPPEWVVAEIANRLQCHHVFFPSGEYWPGALLTRLEVIESANCPIGGDRPKDLFTRHWGRAVLRSAFGPVVVHSVHLNPHKEAIRQREATEVLRVIRNDFESGRPLILQGDFNHTDANPEYQMWVAAGLVDTFRAAGKGLAITMPKPTDKQPRRIDFIWTHGAFVKRVREVRVLSGRPFSLDPKDPDSFALSDHRPVMATFQ